ncbi:hypothetical protein EJB05_25075, partial [Eragrostis curvula]
MENSDLQNTARFPPILKLHAPIVESVSLQYSSFRSDPHLMCGSQAISRKKKSKDSNCSEYQLLATTHSNTHNSI